jgi:hypothetical protein
MRFPSDRGFQAAVVEYLHVGLVAGLGQTIVEDGGGTISHHQLQYAYREPAGGALQAEVSVPCAILTAVSTFAHASLPYRQHSGGDKSRSCHSLRAPY